MHKRKVLISSELHGNSLSQHGPERLGRTCFEQVQNCDGGVGAWRVLEKAHEQLNALLENALSTEENTFKTYVFGGCFTFGFLDGETDMDVCCVPEDDATTLSQKEQAKYCYSVASLLQRLNLSTLVIARARVPIIKHIKSKGITEEIKAVVSSKSPTNLEITLKKNTTDWDQFLMQINAKYFPHNENPRFEKETNPGKKKRTLCFDDSLEAIRVVARVKSSRASCSVVSHCPIALSALKFDLSFSSSAIRNSKLLRAYLLQHPCARPGALVIKKWAKKSGVCDAQAGYLTSYAIVIMWVHYMLHEGMLPFISPSSITASHSDLKLKNMYVPLLSEEQRKSEEFMNAFHKDLGRFIARFFNYYTLVFDWERKVVTLNTMASRLKQEVHWDKDRKRRHDSFFMCIQDPYISNFNLGRGITSKRFAQIQKWLQSHAKIFLESPKPRTQEPSSADSIDVATRLIYEKLLSYIDELSTMELSTATEYLTTNFSEAYGIVRKKYKSISNFISNYTVDKKVFPTHFVVLEDGGVRKSPYPERGQVQRKGKCDNCNAESVKTWTASDIRIDSGAYCEDCWAKY